MSQIGLKDTILTGNVLGMQATLRLEIAGHRICRPCWLPLEPPAHQNVTQTVLPHSLTLSRRLPNENIFSSLSSSTV